MIRAFFVSSTIIFFLLHVTMYILSVTNSHLAISNVSIQWSKSNQLQINSSHVFNVVHCTLYVSSQFVFCWLYLIQKRLRWEKYESTNNINVWCFFIIFASLFHVKMYLLSILVYCAYKFGIWRCVSFSFM